MTVREPSVIELFSRDASGITLILQHLLTITVTLALLAIVVAIGRTALRRGAVPMDGAAEELALAAALGVGAVSTTLLIISFILGPAWYTLWGGLGLLALACRRDLVRLPGLLRRCLSEVLGAQVQPHKHRLAAGALALIIVALVLLALLPPTDWDSLAYHLQVPRQWLLRGHVFMPEDNYHTAFIGVAEVLYLPLLSIGAASATQVLNVGMTLLLGLGTSVATREAAGPRASRVAFWLLLASPIVVLVGVTPMVDVMAAFILIIAHVVVLKGLRPSPGHRLLLLGGLLLGIAFGVKYLGLMYAAALAPLIVIAIIRIARGRYRQCAKLILVVGCAGLLGAAPWLLKNTLLLGDPVYPFLSAPRVELWMRPLYPDLAPVGVDPGIFDVHRQMREPFALRAAIFTPERLAPDEDARDSGPFLLLFLAPLALLVGPWRRVLPLLGPPLGYVVLVLGYSRYTSLRYLIPAIPALTATVAVLIDLVRQRLTGWGRAVLVIGLLVVAIPSPLAIMKRLILKNAAFMALGYQSRKEFLSQYWETRGYWTAVNWLDTHVPRGDRVIMLFEARGYYSESRVEEDLLLRNWAFLAPHAAEPGCLRETGAKFILVNEGSYRYFVGRGVKPASLGWDAFPSFRSRCLKSLYQARGFTIYAIEPST